MLVSVSSGLMADNSQVLVKWQVADGGYQICDTEKLYRQLLHFSLYGVGKKPAAGCKIAPDEAAVKINHCTESDIILCKFTFTPASGSAFTGWASKALLRETAQ